MLHQKEGRSGGHGAMCEGGSCAHCGTGCRLVKAAIVMVILVSVFAVGSAAGVRFAMHRLAGFAGNAIDGVRTGYGDRLGMWGMMFPGARGSFTNGAEWQFSPGSGMMGRVYLSSDSNEWGRTATATARYFGTVNRVEGNKITIVDNGSVEMVILSQSSTRIESERGVMGLTELKPGQKVEVIGVRDAENQFLAKVILVF